MRLRLDSTYPTPTGEQRYPVQDVPLGFGLMFVAGILSALLGIGSGVDQGAGDGPRDAAAVQGLDDDEQLHDRRDRRGERRLYLHRGYIEPGARLSGDARRARRRAARRAGARPREHERVCASSSPSSCVMRASQMLYKGVTGGI